MPDGEHMPGVISAAVFGFRAQCFLEVEFLFDESSLDAGEGSGGSSFTRGSSSWQLTFNL